MAARRSRKPPFTKPPPLAATDCGKYYRNLSQILENPYTTRLSGCYMGFVALVAVVADQRKETAYEQYAVQKMANYN